MSWYKVGKRAADEWRLFCRYWREVDQQRTALSGGLLVSLCLAAWLMLAPPESVPPWVKLALVAAVTFFAQYLAWRARVKREDAGEPEPPKGLSLETELAGTKKEGDHFYRGPHELTLTLTITEPLRVDLYVRCSNPLLGGEARYWIHHTTPLGVSKSNGFDTWLDIIRRSYGVVRMKGVELEPGNTLELILFSNESITVRELAFEPINDIKPPRDLPPSTVSGPAPPP